MPKKIALIQIAMVTPTKECTYAPSKIRPNVEVSQEDFLSQYADTAQAISVSFEQDGKSNATLTTAYTKGGNPMTGRFIKK